MENAKPLKKTRIVVLDFSSKLGYVKMEPAINVPPTTRNGKFHATYQNAQVRKNIYTHTHTHT